MDFQEEAEKILMGVHPQNPERSIQKATVLAYMARTEALKPEAEVRRPDKVWLISMRTNKDDSFGEWSVIEAHTNMLRANDRWRLLSIAKKPDGVELKMEEQGVLS